MVQQQIKIEGTLAACRCGKQPKHYESRGNNTHFLECSPCGVRTAKHTTFQEAVESWENNNTQPFELRPPANPLTHGVHSIRGSSLL